MAKQLSPVEQTTFAQGLITEASPLTFPPNASVDELNFVVNRDGSRRRRLGMDYEQDHTVINSGVVASVANPPVFNTFVWDNAGGDPEAKIGVVQTGSVLSFFDFLTTPYSSNLITSVNLGVDADTFISGTSVDGLFVVATGSKNLSVFSYNGTIITQTTDYLRIRDFFGVEDLDGATDLTQDSGIFVRPATLTDEHAYNLRNQSFNVPRSRRTDVLLYDTLDTFFLEDSSYPSNADAVVYNLYPNVNEANKTLDRFHSEDLLKNPLGTFPASKGHFIIDALERGPSRETQYTNLLAEYSELGHTLTSLPADTTPNGASVVTEFAGRVWFGGFSGDVTDGDDKSPLLSSYIMFSQLVEDPSDIFKCYQESDPTSKDAPDLVATDGGYLRISGAYGIIAMKNLSEKLIVIANNGIWSVYGGDAGFTATEYTVNKITEHGCTSPNSVVELDGGVAYWGDDGIYLVSPNEFGDLVANNISQNTIQERYDSISREDKKYCQGLFDSYDRKIRWVYSTRPEDTTVVNELVFDLNFNAFSPYQISSITSGRPKPVALIETPPFQIGQVIDDVVVGGTQVVVGVDDVQVTSNAVVSGLRELSYVTLVDDSAASELQFTFSTYKDSDFLDWVTYDTIGVDAAGYMVTGYLTGGDSQRKKDSSYLTFHMIRTEDGFEDDGFGDLTPTNPSSCKVQTQWEWTNSSNSNRWGREFQAYRYPRIYFPEDVNDPYDTGHSIITTKNKLRGRGRALSFKISTEAGKDCQILGWAMIVGVAGNV